MRGALFFALGDFRKRTRISPYRFGNCLVVNELAFAAAGDQASFAQNFQVVRNSCRGDAPHGDDFPAAYAPAGGDGLKDFEPGLVAQGFGYFFNLRAIHSSCCSLADLSSSPPQRFEP